MRIEVYKDWIIRTDSLNIILCKSNGMKTEKNKKTGEERECETFKSETSHGTIKQAIDRLCKNEIYACKSTTIKELQNEYAKLNDMIEKFNTELIGGTK